MILLKRNPFVVHKNHLKQGPKMEQKWTQNGPKMGPKWPPKWTPKCIPKWSPFWEAKKLIFHWFYNENGGIRGQGRKALAYDAWTKNRSRQLTA